MPKIPLSQLSDDAAPCKTLLSKAIGLMFSKKRDLLFIFKKEERVSLHMLFVFFPIWAVYLDKEKKVVYIKKLYPFISYCDPKQNSSYILELTKQPNIKIGDTIVF
jgi:uncharacterized protein